MSKIYIQNKTIFKLDISRSQETDSLQDVSLSLCTGIPCNNIISLPRRYLPLLMQRYFPAGLSSLGNREAKHTNLRKKQPTFKVEDVSNQCFPC